MNEFTDKQKVDIALAVYQCIGTIEAVKDGGASGVGIPDCFTTEAGCTIINNLDDGFVAVEGGTEIDNDCWIHLFVRDQDDKIEVLVNGEVFTNMNACVGEDLIFVGTELETAADDNTGLIVGAILLFFVGMICGAELMKSELTVQPVPKIVYTGDCV